MNQSKFDADYFEQKYKKELELRQRKVNERELQREQREIDRKNCSFSPTLATGRHAGGAQTARVTTTSNKLATSSKKQGIINYDNNDLQGIYQSSSNPKGVK